LLIVYYVEIKEKNLEKKRREDQNAMVKKIKKSKVFGVVSIPKRRLFKVTG
jgi:hypothetical protein